MTELSRRERQVQGLLYKGLTYIEIGEQLGISHRTAECHSANLLHKLGYSSVRRMLAARIAELEAA